MRTLLMGAGAAALALLLIAAVVLAALGVEKAVVIDHQLDHPKAPVCGKADKRCVNFAPEAVLADAMYQFDQAVLSTPSDSILAVSESQIVLSGNTQLSVFDKETLTRRAHFPSNGALGTPPVPPSGDPHVIYDPWTNRFIYENWNTYTLGAHLTSSNWSGDVTTANYADPPNPIVAAQLINANPQTGAVNGVPTLLNAASCVGKIVVFMQGGGVFSYDKAQMALAAGAVGVVIVPISNIGYATPSDNRPSLPIVVIGTTRALGLLLIANDGMPVTISVYDEPPTYNDFLLAISHNDHPVTADDWFSYAVHFPASFNAFDFPKLGVDETSIYLSIQNFNTTAESFANSVSTEAIVFVFDKAPLVDGPSDDAYPWINYTLPHQGFLWPALALPPMADQLLPSFFTGTNCPLADLADTGFICNTTAIRVYTSEQPFQGIGGFSAYIDVPLPEPMVFQNYFNANFNGSAQPPPIDTYESTADGTWTSNAVVRNNRLWTTVTGARGDVGTYVRWFELDISRFLSHNEISLVQWGDLTHIDGATTGFPAISVDIHGNMAIAFVLSSPTLAPRLAYTGRLAADPPGTVRFPYQTPLPSEYPITAGANFGSNAGRYGDYSGIVLDPADGETFYITVEHPSQLSSDVVDGVTYGWTMPIVRFRLALADAAGGPVPRMGPAVEATPITPTWGTGSGAHEGEEQDPVPE